MNGERESIGQRLRRLRLERGLSQRELSEPGVSYAYISRIEAGARRPSVKALRLLAKKLGVSADYLETGSEIGDSEERELRLADAELELRLADDPSAAEATLAELLREAEEAGDRMAAGRARVALGFLASRQSRAADAVEQLERAIETGILLPTARPDVYTTLGRAYAATGNAKRAVELFEDCLAEVTAHRPDDTAAHVRFAVYLSHALSDVGEFERAEEVLKDALERTDDLVDPMMRVRLYRSLGRLSALEARPAAALDNFRRAIALLEATEDTIHLARAHLGCAWTLISADRAEEAGAHLEAAERLFGDNAEMIDRAYLRTEQARHSARTGNGPRAIQYAEEALALLGEADPGEQGSAWWALAEGLALQGSNERANDAFQLATELLEHHGQRRAAADALRAWAKLLRRMGREPEAGYAEARAEVIAKELVSARAT